jgi:hypothetical protein
MADKYTEAQFSVDEAWLTANQSVVVTQPSRALVADGRCGRCHDQTQYPIDLEPVAIAGVSEAGPVVSLDVTRMFRCRCIQPHQGRPRNVYTGCGAYWFARVTGRPGSYLLTPAPPEFVPGAIAVDQAAREQGTLVKQTSEKWLGAITALLTLFSIGGAAFTATSVATLNTAGKLFAAVAAVLAVGCGAVAIYYGYRAAYGWLTMAPTATETAATALANPARGIPERVAAFRRSSPAAALSLGFAVIALLVIWFTPPASPPAPLVSVSYGHGNGQATVCGMLLDSDGGQVVRMQVQVGALTMVRRVPQPITKISAVASCPP